MLANNRLFGALLVAFAVGAVGLWCVFTDLGPREATWTRLLLVCIVYAIGAGAIGALAPERWYLSLLAAWGPGAMGLIGLAGKLIRGGSPPYWSFLASTLLGIPGVALFFGYLGAKLRGRSA